MTAAGQPEEQRGPARHRWLQLIGLLKLLLGGFFVAVGIGLLRILHQDMYMFALQMVEALHLDPDRLFIAHLLDKVSLLDLHRMKQLTLLVFLYAALDFVEGTGLLLEKRWAEYFTLILTVALLPLEVIKLIHHSNHWTFGLLLANLLIAVYLAWLVLPSRFRTSRDLSS